MTGQILAATLTIAFEGLMMFQEGSGGRQSVLIVDANDRQHHPSIHVCKVEGDVVRHLDINLTNKDVITFARSGPVTLDHRFRVSIPELQKFIITGHIDDQVVNLSTQASGVLARADLPAGKLTTWSNFPEQAEFETDDGQITQLCLPRFSILLSQVPLPTDVTITHVDGTMETLQVDEHEMVIISNVSVDTEHPHFPHYKKLLASNGILGGVDVLKLRHCNTAIGKGDLSPQIEKILEFFVARTPNGDCGQSRNPSGP
jgi:hypothetical protein